jgi:5'-nucleotidase
VTNDDGISSPGLLWLAAMAADAGFEVIIAAPAFESSGSSASIAAAESDGKIVMERRRLDGLEGVPAYAVKAPPALITLIAGHGAFGTPPDLVLSGINRGANVGRAILHSGTVGAALTAGVNGARGIAVSLDVGTHTDNLRWSTACDVVHRLLAFVTEQPAGAVLNLNVPDVAPDKVAGLREAPLAPFGVVQTTMTEQGEGHIRLSVAEDSGTYEPGTDADLLAQGYATVTSINSVGAASHLTLHELVDDA